MFGHTHRPYLDQGKEITVLNPGSVSYPRQEGRKGSYMIMEMCIRDRYWDNKKPGMDIISTGPNLYDVHSTKEKVSKESISHMWLYLTELLKELA